MEQLYEKVYSSRYLRRPNRFVVEVELDGRLVTAHLPNPGRMWELLFPGVTIYVVPHTGQAGKLNKTAYRVVGIERDGVPIMLDTNYSNDVAEHLIRSRQIPGWEEWSVVRREYTVGKSRFDLLLTNDLGESFLLEVKSCTLFSRQGAMFPDAITERGRKHLLHLRRLQEDGWHTGVLFLVQWDRASWFLPDYHTDLAFAETFLETAPFLDWKAVAVRWDKSFTLPEVKQICTYNEELLAQEAKDSGDYILVLRLPAEADIVIGSKGLIHFPAGYYLYVGSARANLTKRLERHKRKRKNKHWHIDYLRDCCEVIAAVPIRTSEDLECELAAAVESCSTWSVPGFGCSDCRCESHLFGMAENPIHNQQFMAVVEDFRMNRLDAKQGK